MRGTAHRDQQEKGRERFFIPVGMKVGLMAVATIRTPNCDDMLRIGGVAGIASRWPGLCREIRIK